MLERECIICGRQFKPLYANQQTCSKECAHVQEANRRAAYMKDYKKNKAKKRKSCIDEIAAEAQALGLTYGQYKARQWLKEQEMINDRV